MSLVILRKTDPHSVWPGAALTLSARFVDADSNVDQTPSSVALDVFAPGTGAGAPTYTITYGVTPPLPPPWASFSQSMLGAQVSYDAVLFVQSSWAHGIWPVRWRALDASGNALATDWGAFVVEVGP